MLLWAGIITSSLQTDDDQDCSGSPGLPLTYVNSRDSAGRLALPYRLVKKRAVTRPIANAPITKPHAADAWSASIICPRLNSTIISNAETPGIMMTIGATVSARRGTL